MKSNKIVKTKTNIIFNNIHYSLINFAKESRVKSNVKMITCIKRSDTEILAISEIPIQILKSSLSGQLTNFEKKPITESPYIVINNKNKLNIIETPI